MASISLWNIPTGYEITTLIERTSVNIALPVANGLSGIEIELISGNLPTGTRIEGTSILGTAYEVITDTVFNATLRAHWQGYFDDRTIKIIVTGSDEPQWLTAQGLLPIGNNNTFFILDSELIDFQLMATDNDLPAGDVLEFFIADGDGELPPGITLTENGRLQGIVEPLLALDKRYLGGGYDTMPYGDIPLDYAIRSGNGYGSFFYDTVTFDYSDNTVSLRKLNRYYPFAVTVTDGDTFVRREFKIYVVGDDFLRADTTDMSASTNVFTADATHLRTPSWVTPRNLGYRRANNYTTIYLDIIDNSTLTGTVVYTLDDVNDDGSPSELPPGLSLDSNNGELSGIIPYQPAITENYKFTVRATRFEGDIETVTIFGTFYEDTLLGASSFKIGKLDLTGLTDGIADLQALRNRKILINNREYTIINIDDRNPDYDIIFVNDTIGPNISLLLSRTANIGQGYFFASRLTDSQREKYQGRTLNFSTTSISDSYVIQDIIPYIEYEITQTDAEFDPILPANSPRSMAPYENFFAGQYAVYSSAVGGNNRIYICNTAHSIEAQVDGDGLLVTDGDGNIQIVFDSSKWTEVAESLSSMSVADRVTATRQALDAEFGGTTYIDVIEQNRWRIKMISSAQSRIITNIKNFFASDTSSTQILVRVIRDNEDRISLNRNLTRQLNGGRNIGIALFRGDYFFKNIPITSDDEVVLPSKAKTFEISVIGEIDSNIKWLTDSYLGKINANFTSTLKVEAETSVPDSRMIYTIVDGKLPYGMRLNYTGEIIGVANQFENSTSLGLTTFDNRAVTWDGNFPGDTTFDRRYKFTVEARDRFNYTAITREFILDVEDLDNTLYTDIYAKPMLKPEQRELYTKFIAQPDVFIPDRLYRPDDPRFGLQRQIKMLVYAGVEAVHIENFVAAAAKNHKRKKYILGNIKKAVAKEPGTTDVIYEVVYVEVIDSAMTSKGKTKSSFTIDTTQKLTVDSIQYAVKDDETKTGAGYSTLPVYGRNTVQFVFPDRDSIVIRTRDGNVDLNVDNNDFIVTLSDGPEITVELELSDSEPMRRRPTTNTIKADSNAVKVSQTKDQVRYISSIEHMRDNIKGVGKNERNYLPLWMRSSQEGFQELGYVSAIPICYCKPGTADEIILNIKNNGFDFRNINFDIDRYIVERTNNNGDEQYILFANYQFNV